MLIKYMCRLAVPFVFLLCACGVPSTASQAQPASEVEVSGVYTDLGAPELLNGGVVRMQDGEQICYLIYGRTGVGVSCPTGLKNHSEPEGVVYTDLGAPELLNGGVVRMQDGEQICYLIYGRTGVGVECD